MIKQESLINIIFRKNQKNIINIKIIIHSNIDSNVDNIYFCLKILKYIYNKRLVILIIY